MKGEGWELFNLVRAAACDFWIRIFRIYRINYNVSGLGVKVIIKRYFHFKAFRRCVTHRRKEGYKMILYEYTIKLKPETSSLILKIL